MPDIGFAIQCPRCGKWNEQNTTVIDDSVIVRTKDEFDSILKGQSGGSTGPTDGGKIFGCKQPYWSCPGSYKALIFSDRRLAIKCLNDLHKTKLLYNLSRDFRLYKADKRNRWEDYHCIMFFPELIHRIRHIELEHLMDSELIKRLINDISSEINAPLTMYSANVFESSLSDTSESDICWMPIEAYSPNQELIPAKYNRFCDACRQAVIEFIQKEKFGSENCGYWDDKMKTCAGREPACLPKNGDRVDWNHCPYFIDARREHCPCYNADTMFIEKKVKQNWRNGKLSELCEKNKCLAGFHEAAFPVIVHDHLVGVAMTGQVFFRENDLPDVEDFINSRHKVHDAAYGTSWDALKGRKNELEKMKQVLLWEQEQLKKKTHSGSGQNENPIFYFDQNNQYEDRLKRLKKSIDKIEEVASIRYRDVRTRSEIAFCEGMVSYVRHAKQNNLPVSSISNEILNKMRDFWAFKYAGLLSHPLVPHSNSMANAPQLLALSSEGQLQVSLPYTLTTSIQGIYDKGHPISWYYDPINKDRPSDEWTQKLFEIVLEFKREVIKNSLLVDVEDICYLLVIVPFEDEVYSFAFSERDAESVSRTERLYPQGISQLCREFILTTCTQVVHELGDVLVSRMQKGTHKILSLPNTSTPKGQQKESPAKG